MVRFEEIPLNDSLALLRHHLLDIVHAGIAGAAGPLLVARALSDPAIAGSLEGRPVTVIAAGKVAVPMVETFVRECPQGIRAGLVARTVGDAGHVSLECQSVGHPVPDDGSLIAGRRALALARQVVEGELLVVLLSGGASAGLTVPVDGLMLDDKMKATQALLRGGVAIDGINCVRKHLSAIKGGRLAAATEGSVLTLAISDVVGPNPDDPAVIGSGPTAPDPTRFADAVKIADLSAVRPAFPQAARAALERGCRGESPETPKPGDARLRRSHVHVIGSRIEAMREAARAAAALGYSVRTVTRPVVGEARRAGESYVQDMADLVRQGPRPACIVSAGETTVEVKGPGRGGRNQEFALAAVQALGRHHACAVLASVGTDGIDGPTDAAGAVVDTTTLTRAHARGLREPTYYLEANDSYAFFDELSDLIRLPDTQTNVGDLQVALVL